MEAFFPLPDLAACFLQVRRQLGNQLSPSERNVWEFVLDKTLGFGKAADILSLSQLQAGTGLCDKSALAGLRGLEQKGVLYQHVLRSSERLVLLSTSANVELLAQLAAGTLTETELKDRSRQRLAPPEKTSPPEKNGGGEKSSPPEDFGGGKKVQGVKNLRGEKTSGGEKSSPRGADAPNPDADSLSAQGGEKSSGGEDFGGGEKSSPHNRELTPDRIDLNRSIEEEKQSEEAAREGPTSPPSLDPDPADPWFTLLPSAGPPPGVGFTRRTWLQYCTNRAEYERQTDPDREAKERKRQEREAEAKALQARQSKQANRLSQAQREKLATLQAQPLFELVSGLYARCIPTPSNARKDAEYMRLFVRDLEQLVPEHPRVLLMLEAAFEQACAGNGHGLYVVKLNLHALCSKASIPCPEHWGGKKKGAA